MENNGTSRKALARQYKERIKLGGVYLIRNTLTGKLLLEATTNLQGSKNRFAFAQSTGSCIDLKLQADWDRQGSADFVLEVLEELDMGEGQSDADFKKDILLLKELWLEKLSGSVFY